MPSKVNPTPTFTGKDAKNFIEKLNTPSTKEELKSLRKSDDIFNKLEYIP